MSYLQISWKAPELLKSTRRSGTHRSSTRAELWFLEAWVVVRLSKETGKTEKATVSLTRSKPQESSHPKRSPVAVGKQDPLIEEETIPHKAAR